MMEVSIYTVFMALVAYSSEPLPAMSSYPAPNYRLDGNHKIPLSVFYPASRRIKPLLCFFHLHENYFIENSSESFYSNSCRPTCFAFNYFIICQYEFYLFTAQDVSLPWLIFGIIFHPKIRA
jgi:hypothetical protein